ncbi:MAG: hypothetical protein ABGX04_08755 [Myxococcales bacterium]
MSPTLIGVYLLRTFVLALIKIAIGVAIGLASVEVGLRSFGISYPIFFVPDPIAGARMWPNLKAWYTHEGRGYIEVNSIGYRDHDHPKSKPDGEFRFALLGDSMTEALQVPFEDTYWNVARRELQGCEALSGRTPVPLNFAISGFGTAQQLEVLGNIVWDYDPDLVLLAFVPNDITDNHPAYGSTHLKPYYVFDDSGALVLDDSFKTSPGFLRRMSPLVSLRRNLIQNSRVLQLLLEIRTEYYRRTGLAQMKSWAGKFNQPSQTETVREAWSLTEALLARVAEDVAAHDRDFLLLVTTSGHQVHPDPEYLKRRLEIERTSDLYYWNKRISSFAADIGIEHLSLAEPFVTYATENETCLHGFENSVPCGGHWNSKGHLIAGQLLADAICNQLTAADGVEPAS